MSLIPLGFWAASGGGGGGGFDLLETTVLTSTATTVSFTGLDAYSDYKHLQLRMLTRDSAAQNVNLRFLRFNGVSTSDYYYHSIYASATTVTKSKAAAGYINLGRGVSNSQAANIFSQNLVDILDFSSTNKRTTTRALQNAYGSSFRETGLWSGMYNSTEAITSLELALQDSGGFMAGSRFSIYGIAG